MNWMCFLFMTVRKEKKRLFAPKSVVMATCDGTPCVLPLCSRYLNAIQTMCPHILRYLTTAVITNKDVRKRRQVLKDLVKVIQQVRPTGVWRLVLIKRRPAISAFSLAPAGVVHIQGPDHRVRGVPLCELRLRQRPKEAQGVWVGELP